MNDRLGFNIEGKFYPLSSIEDWQNQDFVLASQITKKDLDDLLEQRDTVLYRQALIAVAYRHGSPGLSIENIVEYLWSLKPTDIENIGFAVEDDARPPESENASESESSENSTSPSPTSGERSAATPET